jgi:hypothetical protein
MGLTKQYLRYVASAVFGLIGSQKGNIVFVTLRGEKGRYVAVPACEHVFIWDLRKGEKVSQKSTRLIIGGKGRIGRALTFHALEREKEREGEREGLYVHP